MAHLFGRALTDPLFILFTTLSLLTLDGFLNTRRRSFLLAAAATAALAWLTRYIGVTLVASGLLLLALHRGVPLSTRIRNAALYATIAGTPMCLWMLRNLMHTGAPLGKMHPTGFSVLSSLNAAGTEFSTWLFGDRVLHAPGRWLASEFAIGGDPVIVAASVKFGALLLVAGGFGYALMRLRRRGYAPAWNMLAVPVVFASVYALFLTITLPLGDVDLPPRYLAPIYPPMLFVATLVLNGLLRCAADSWTPVKPTFLRKWNVGKKTIPRPALILMTCLSLWLVPQLHASYGNIKAWLDEGFGYASRQRADSDTVRYVISSLHNGQIRTNRANTLYFLTDTGDRLWGLPGVRPRPDDVRHWIGYWTDRVDAYFVWFYEPEKSVYEYGPAELAASVPGVEVEAILEDGVIFRSGKDAGGDVGPLDAEAVLQTALKNARLVARSDFDVYQDENEDRLIYVREACRADDIKARFFLHVFPMDVARLPDRRRQYGFDNASVAFGGHGLRLGDLCIAVRNLPDYPIAAIHTGQFIPGEGRLWTSEFTPD